MKFTVAKIYLQSVKAKEAKKDNARLSSNSKELKELKRRNRVERVAKRVIRVQSKVGKEINH